MRKWAGAEDEPNAKYRDAHAWYDSDKPENFGSYKLLIADVVDGRLKAVPRGVMAAGTCCRAPVGGSTCRQETSPGEVPPGEVLQEDGRRPPWER